MGRFIQLLCESSFESNRGIQWLVGSRWMPFTVVSIMQCLRFVSNTGDPDCIAESDDLRVLLPKGLEVVGVLLNEVGDLTKMNRAGDFTLKLISCLNPELETPTQVLVAYLEPGSSSLQCFLYTGHASADIEAVDQVIYHEKPSTHLWANMCLLRCKMQLKVPLYVKSFANSSDYEAQLSTAVANIVDDLRSPRIFCHVEGVTGKAIKSIQILLKPGGVQQSHDVLSTQAIYTDEITENSKHGMLLCSDLCHPDFWTSSTGLQMPLPLNLKLMRQQSMRQGRVSAPSAEYLPASGEAIVKILRLNLDAICLAHRKLSVCEAAVSLVLPALIDQLLALKSAVLTEYVEQAKLNTFHFCPPGFIHPISTIYDISFGESELKIMEYRRFLHQRLGLPMDRPFLRIANALSFKDALDENRNGKLRLSNLHANLPSSGVVGGHTSMIEGSYEYYHYLQGSFNDNGWGCAYRSLQTIISWFRLQNYTSVDVPTHRMIQEVLVEIGDKEPSFIGSQEWIGAIELSFVLDKLLGVTSKILNVRSGAELPERCRELSHHFETQCTPVMIGGGVLAYTLLGVDFNEATGDSAFLILDPHYTGGEDLKNILSGGWCGWKKAISSKGEEFFLRNKFYNLLLPQRPNTV